ncbi:MAG: NapC/NirT family cytochrome c [Anaerolineae bacterium]
MRQNITRFWGHIFALLFTAVLLLVGKNFFQLYPLLSAFILAIFAGVYVAAAIIPRETLMLYPGTILLVVSYNLLLYSLNVPAIYLPLLSTPLVFVFYFLARYLEKRKLEFVSSGLNGSTILVTSGFTLIVLFKAALYSRSAPLLAFFTLILFALYFVLRYLIEKKAWHLWTFTLLAVPSFLFLLHSDTWLALYLASVLTWLVVARNLSKKQMVAESILLAFIVLYLVAAGYLGWGEDLIPLGYVACSLLLVSLGFALYSGLQEIVPFLAAGFVLTVLPMALTYPWTDYSSLVAFLGSVFFLYIMSGGVLLQREKSMLGLMVGHSHVTFGEIVALGALIYTAVRGFTPSYPNSLTALVFAAVAVLAGFRVRPLVVKFRWLLFYLAGLFLTLSFMAALFQADPFKNTAANLFWTVPFILLVYAIGQSSRNRVDEAGYYTILGIPVIAVAVAGAVYVLQETRLPFSTALLLPAAFIIPGILYYFRLKLIEPLLSSVVAVTFLFLNLLVAVGLSKSISALAFLILGMAMAAWGLDLTKKKSRWNYLLLFSLGVATLTSIALGYPWKEPEIFVTALWPVVYLITSSFLVEAEHRLPKIVLEASGYLLMLFTIVALLVNGFLMPAAIVSGLYALTFFFVWARRRVGPYLYPASIFTITALFLALLLVEQSAFYILFAVPLTVVFYGAGVYFDKRGQSDYTMPLYIGGHLNGLVGAVAFLVLTARLNDLLGLAGALLHLLIHLFMAYKEKESTFLAGAGLSLSLSFLIALSFLPFVQASNVLAYFIPVVPLLFIYGWVLRKRGDTTGSWATFSSVIVLTILSSAAAIWVESIDPASTWIVLIVGSLLWLGFLFLTKLDIFVYLITATLAFLGYSFLRSVEDRFFSHMFIFMVYGCLLIALIFIYDILRNRFRFRSPVHFGKRMLWTEKLLYVSPVIVLSLVALGGFTVESTSNPVFCNICHKMSPYYASWQQSLHGQAGISCTACHYEPNVRSYIRTKVVGLTEVVKTATATEKFKPMAVVSDQSCLRGGCHTIEALKNAPVLLEGRVSFSHADHLDRTLRDVEIHCSVCHTMVTAESHFSVNENACSFCHFKGRGSEATYIGECLDCHAAIQTAPPKGGFSHEALLEGEAAIDCTVCHEDLTSGDGGIKKEECFSCHIENPEQLLGENTLKIHQAHITDKGIGCYRCHEKIKHGIK